MCWNFITFIENTQNINIGILDIEEQTTAQLIFDTFFADCNVIIRCNWRLNM